MESFDTGVGPCPHLEGMEFREDDAPRRLDALVKGKPVSAEMPCYSSSVKTSGIRSIPISPSRFTTHQTQHALLETSAVLMAVLSLETLLVALAVARNLECRHGLRPTAQRSFNASFHSPLRTCPTPSLGVVTDAMARQDIGIVKLKNGISKLLECQRTNNPTSPYRPVRRGYPH